MCIIASVGKNGLNSSRDDVKTIQHLLNLNLSRIGPLRTLKVDGKIGKNTIAVIELFQRNVQGISSPDGRIDPPGPKSKSIYRLREGIPSELCADVLQGIFIRASRQKIDSFAPALITKMRTAGIVSRLERAHFLAQIGHESGELRYTEEIASGEAYEGRSDLGNSSPGDGKRFKGRGLIQLTGRANYKEFSRSRIPRIDYVDFTEEKNAKLISQSRDLSVEVAIWFWQKHDLAKPAAADDLIKITKKINGGTNGIADRRRLLNRAKFFLKETA